ncbi:non-muscle caldesmon isoform X2 [Electrophorus electricus]|uniref:non-muscle caldesmon isoform X2 n=1 Tax=Electrophorus electricus TaxID=8005 RepID=UPI0015D00D6B|nr:non-muscle caldesmon isoform X2 [Electrophorus electricus]
MSMLRQHSRKQGLLNLQRITVQRSLEDAQESERERRCRARAASSTVSAQDRCKPQLCQDSPCEREQDSLLSLEDADVLIGFSQHVEKQSQTNNLRKVEAQLNAHQLQPQFNSSAQHSKQQINGSNGHVNSALCCLTPPPLSQQRNEDGEEDEDEWVEAGECREKEREEQRSREREESGMVVMTEAKGRGWVSETPRQEDMQIKSRESQRYNTSKSASSCHHCHLSNPTLLLSVREKRKEMRITCTSKPRLQQEVRCDITARQEEALKSMPCLVEGEPVTGLEISENPHHSEKEEQSLFQEETEEWRMKEETEEERVKRMREEERERKRRDVMERIKKLSLSSSEADEPFSPLSPTLMISERTECLSRSVKNSNSVKKTEPPMTISKIDSRLEQYNHAVELSGQEARDTKQVLMDLAASPEPLAARKNLFEVGETWNQNQKVLSTKDTEGLNVGVADLITQWVKGSPDVHCKSPSSKPTPNEVKSGDVRLKKTMWETLETSSTKKPEGKASLGKKFKFVETGHGKYEKVLVGDSDSINHTNRKQSQ